MGLILITSAVFRITLLGSTPIQEIDIYRYVWDGAASSVGVSPFRYTPEQVRTAPSGQSIPADLARLVALRDSSPALATILGRIHYAHLPTIYPPGQPNRLRGGRAWLAMSGLVLMYYLRFWLGYHWTKTPLLGTPYFGHELFDFIVTWLEFAPWLIWLSVESFLRGRSSLASTPSDGPTI